MPADFGNLYTTYGQQYGLDPQLLARISKIESGGNPAARTGSYRGLFQMGPAEWQKYGSGGDINDPEANTRAASAKIAAESASFRSQYGRDPTPTDIYMLHQQGAGGYGAHLARPDAPAWQNMAGTGEGRTKGDDWARAAIWGNIPDRDKQRFGSVDNVTSNDFVNLWRTRVEGDGSTPGSAGAPSFGAMTPQMAATPDASAPSTPSMQSQPNASSALMRMAFGALSPPQSQPDAAPPPLLPVWHAKPYRG